MKKTLLFAISIVMSAPAVLADGITYTYPEEDTGLRYGMFQRVSNNGKWAVGFDDFNSAGALVVNTEDPENLIVLGDGELYDASDDGILVGSLYENIGTPSAPVNYRYAATYENGIWYKLPTPPSQMGESFARAITPDGKYIGGMAFCKDESIDIKGRFYPVVWTYNPDIFDYDVHAFTDLELPANMGMDINDISEDGTILAGMVRTYAGSDIPAMLRDGQLVIWNSLEVKPWYFILNDEIQKDKDGNPILYETGFCDGIMDGGGEDDSWFTGTFHNISGDYIYGHRSKVKSVDPETCLGSTEHYRFVYSISTNEFMEQPSPYAFTCGSGVENVYSYKFTGGGYTATVMHDGLEESVADAFNLDGDADPSVIYSVDKSGKVLVGSAVWFNDAIGEFCDSPCLVILDGGAGVDDIIADKPAATTDKAVYDLFGRRMLNDANGINNLPAGIYIHSGKKVLVR